MAAGAARNVILVLLARRHVGTSKYLFYARKRNVSLSFVFISCASRAEGEMEIGKLLSSGNELPQNTSGGRNKTYKLQFEAERAPDDLRRHRHPESSALKVTPGSQRDAKQNIPPSALSEGGCSYPRKASAALNVALSSHNKSCPFLV